MMIRDYRLLTELPDIHMYTKTQKVCKTKLLK